MRKVPFEMIEPSEGSEVELEVRFPKRRGVDGEGRIRAGIVSGQVAGHVGVINGVKGDRGNEGSDYIPRGGPGGRGVDPGNIRGVLRQSHCAQRNKRPEAETSDR